MRSSLLLQPSPADIPGILVGLKHDAQTDRILHLSSIDLFGLAWRGCISLMEVFRSSGEPRAKSGEEMQAISPAECRKCTSRVGDRERPDHEASQFLAKQKGDSACRCSQQGGMPPEYYWRNRVFGESRLRETV